MGMCGGPALTQAVGAAAAASGADGAQQCEKAAATEVVCIGVLEGIVPPDFDAVAGMAGAACCVPAADIRDLLDVADVDMDGMLDMSEFCLAMYLIDYKECRQY